MYSVCIYIPKSCGYYDFHVLSMSVMGFQKKKFGWVGGWGELYSSLVWIFGIFLTFANPPSIFFFAASLGSAGTRASSAHKTCRPSGPLIMSTSVCSVWGTAGAMEHV